MVDLDDQVRSSRVSVWLSSCSFRKLTLLEDDIRTASSRLHIIVSPAVYEPPRGHPCPQRHRGERRRNQVGRPNRFSVGSVEVEASWELRHVREERRDGLWILCL